MTIDALYERFKNSSGISTDSRAIKPGAIFFALKGERFNGNLFVEGVLEQGASAAVTDEMHGHSDERIILVENVLSTLQQLANQHRRQTNVKVFAVAGSNGKTTTKELISRVLQTSFNTFATKGNLNNHIGVPLSLLSIRQETEFAIIEIGANHLGETRRLCEIAEPDFGLITNNGKDHLEGYGSIEGVRRGNGELFDFLRLKNKTAFVCADEDDLMPMSEGMNRITYGENEIADCQGRITQQFPFIQLQTSNLKFQTQLIGRYNFENIMAAVCCGQYFGVPEEKISESIATYQPLNNRSQILKRGTNTFILDAYNANPSSVNAALENFFLLPAENKIVILGDMAELGASSHSEHRDVIERLRNEKLQMKILVGEDFEKALATRDASILHFKNVEQLKEWFSRQSFENYFFLLKASRIIGLEKLLS
jgi:UDP-N-acetylmuramoyl-tripeptide--D-alanyl-D-alanine ligase